MSVHPGKAGWGRISARERSLISVDIEAAVMAEHLRARISLKTSILQCHYSSSDILLRKTVGDLGSTLSASGHLDNADHGLLGRPLAERFLRLRCPRCTDPDHADHRSPPPSFTMDQSIICPCSILCSHMQLPSRLHRARSSGHPKGLVDQPRHARTKHPLRQTTRILSQQRRQSHSTKSPTQEEGLPPTACTPPSPSRRPEVDCERPCP